MWRKKKYLDFRLFKALITVCLLSLEFCDLDRFFQKNEKLSNSTKVYFSVFIFFEALIRLYPRVACYRIKKICVQSTLLESCLTFYLAKYTVFRHVTSVRQRENSESPWGIEPQTFKFRALMLYYWATETLQWARSIMKFI